jgi:hypothetical protein
MGFVLVNGLTVVWCGVLSFIYTRLCDTRKFQVLLCAGIFIAMIFVCMGLALSWFYAGAEIMEIKLGG